MKVASEVSADKLRGGFYSPQSLVAVCLDRVRDLLGDRTGLRVLEPTAGDGAFLRGLAAHGLGAQVSHVVAVELLATAAARCVGAWPFESTVECASFLDELDLGGQFDMAVGNPPFVRFQFVDPALRSDHGVSNLWVPVFLKALSCLRPGGAFAFIVPAEGLTGISASLVRAWLIEHTASLRVDLFPPGSFPEVLQEVVVVSGVRSDRGDRSVRLVEREARWSHVVDRSAPTWTRYLLTPAQLEAFAEVAALPSCVRLAELARFIVATVTGANDYFAVDEATIEEYGLRPWARPLLARVRHAPGLCYGLADHGRNITDGVRSSIVDFGPDRPDPMADPEARRYLELGVARGLPDRYKCRIRRPWYRVPIVRPGALLLSKRSHRYPRMIVNRAGAVTTDTIYQGSPVGLAEPAAVAASFHSSLTLLSAEIEGRSFGGGVLELVPSEVARLRLLYTASLADELSTLDNIARSGERYELLVEETDRRLTKAVDGLTDALVAQLAEARHALLRRRLDRR